MKDNQKEYVNLLGFKVWSLGQKKLIEQIEKTIKNNNDINIISLNSYKLYLIKKNGYSNLIQSSDLIIPDGTSIRFAAKILSGTNVFTISGAELMISLIYLAAKQNYKIYFLGSPSKLLKKVKLKINTLFPGYSAFYLQHGYYDLRLEEEVVRSINDFNPQFLFIAFGSPRKEQFLSKYSRYLNCNVKMGVGGSYEYFVGDVKLDQFTKRIGFRWLVRSLQDPLRLFPRYLKCNTYFLFLLIKEYIKNIKK